MLDFRLFLNHIEFTANSKDELSDELCFCLIAEELCLGRSIFMPFFRSCWTGLQEMDLEGTRRYLEFIPQKIRLSMGRKQGWSW